MIKTNFRATILSRFKTKKESHRAYGPLTKRRSFSTEGDGWIKVLVSGRHSQGHQTQTSCVLKLCSNPRSHTVMTTNDMINN